MVSRQSNSFIFRLVMIKNPILLELPMPILTPRLLIRPRQFGEGKVIARAINESLDHLKPWMPFAQKPASETDAEIFCRQCLANFIARKDFVLSIYDKEGTQFIGSTGFHKANWGVPSLEIGYWVHKDFEGQGFIAETVNALTRYAFKVVGVNRLEIRCDSRNTKSLRVMKKLGFVEEALLKNEERAEDNSLRNTLVTARYDLLGLPDLEVRW